MTREEIFKSIEEELQKAEEKHPNWPSNIFEQMAIVNEEAGEAVRACLHLKHENGGEHDIHDELIQTAAMCIRMLINKPLNNVLKSYHCPNCNTKSAVKDSEGFECLDCDERWPL